MDRLLKLLTACLLLSSTLTLDAQQLPIYTQYRENASIINPAAVHVDYLAFEKNVSFGASYRNQWVGIDNAPTTATFRGDYLYAENGAFNFMAGGHVVNDQTGPTGSTGLYGRFGGLITEDPYYGGIGLGISGGMVQYRVNVDEIRLRDRQETLTANNQTQWSPDVGVGLFAYKRLEGSSNGDIIYGGLSAPQILGLDLEFKDATGDFSTKRIYHAYANIGFMKFFRDEGFIEPSVWVKYAPNAPINVDINLRYQLRTNFWIGAGGSTAGTSHLEVGVLIGENLGFENNLKVGYGFDYSFTKFGPDTGTTHEIHVSYAFEY